MDWTRGFHNPPATNPTEPPLLTLLRTLWVMTRPPNKSVTAGIYQTTIGHELRVYYSQDESNLLDSLLSRTDDAPLVARASELVEILKSQNWVAAG